MNHVTSGSATPSARGSQLALATLTSLFFMWGFITALNDILIPHLKALFDLTYTQAMLVQSCFFGAYFLISIPGGKLVQKIGYQKGIAVGLVTAAAGCLLFIPSALWVTYWMFLGALFVLASGITILQVAANPLVTIMGDPATASSRLTMTQAFNSLGTTVAPIVGGILLFGGAHAATSDVNADAVILPYVGLAIALVGIAAIMLKINLPNASADASAIAQAPDSKIFHHRHLMFGVIGIFLYVGAEVSIGSFLVNYFASADVLSMTEGQAAGYLAYYWGGAMVGRFIGAALMQKIKPGKLLAFNSALSVILITTSVFSTGYVAMWSILLVGLCNSIMFPTIFSLALFGLGKETARGSGLLCLAIVGGAIVPLLQGMLADNIGLQWSFLLPAVCYLYIGFYGLSGSNPAHNKGE